MTAWSKHENEISRFIRRRELIYTPSRLPLGSHGSALYALGELKKLRNSEQAFVS
jgi:hypothetical protein